jgi:hypothetical protein
MWYFLKNKVSIASIKIENRKYLRFRVSQKNSSFFKIIQNPAYSEPFFFKSSNETPVGHQKSIYLVPQNWKGANNSYGGYPNKYAGWTQNP